MDLLIAVGALVLLMLVAYRGFSVILFAPIAAMLAVLLTDPAAVPAVFTGVFMEKMVGFVKSYFPVFLLGAVFGKVIELSGFSKSIVAAVIGLVGRERAMLSIVLVGALLTYGGVSLVRGCIRGLSVRGRDVPAGRDPEAAHPRHDRIGRIHLHHGFAAGHAADPEHHPDDLLQDRHLGGPDPRHHRGALHPSRRDGIS